LRGALADRLAALGFGYLSVTWVSIALASIALVAIAWAAALQRRPQAQLNA
jgi:hypothetical protein